MILVDTSIWIDHFHSLDAKLQSLLEQRQVLIHPFVIGEISLGNLRQYDLVMRSLSRLYQISKASDDDVLYFIRSHKLQGMGIGYIDAHLAAAAMLTPGTYLWTRDKRLQRVAEDLRIAAPLWPANTCSEPRRHGDPSFGICAMVNLELQSLEQSCWHLTFIKRLKPKRGVKRRVERHMAVRRQGDTRCAARLRRLDYGLHQAPPDTLALPALHDVDLHDIDRPIKFGSGKESEGLIQIVHRYEQQFRIERMLQLVARHGPAFVLHAEYLAESYEGIGLDLRQKIQVSGTSKANSISVSLHLPHVHHIFG